MMGQKRKKKGCIFIQAAVTPDLWIFWRTSMVLLPQRVEGDYLIL